MNKFLMACNFILTGACIVLTPIVTPSFMNYFILFIIGTGNLSGGIVKISEYELPEKIKKNER